jgi:phosphoglycerate dehydrogenase-like enzyme
LRGLESHAWLVNVARGARVVTDDLVVALRERWMGGAALDVTSRSLFLRDTLCGRRLAA